MSAVGKVSLPPDVQVLRSGPTGAPDPQYNVAIGYLRAFITVLVVASRGARLSPVCSSSPGFAVSSATLVDGLSSH